MSSEGPQLTSTALHKTKYGIDCESYVRNFSHSGYVDAANTTTNGTRQYLLWFLIIASWDLVNAFPTTEKISPIKNSFEELRERYRRDAKNTITCDASCTCQCSSTGAPQTSEVTSVGTTSSTTSTISSTTTTLTTSTSTPTTSTSTTSTSTSTTSSTTSTSTTSTSTTSTSTSTTSSTTSTSTT
ncbi:unnamed protein product, partial [Rotaria socialis]